jgi:hypothetical protein
VARLAEARRRRMATLQPRGHTSKWGLSYATTFIFDEPSSADIESERAEAFAASGLMAVVTIGLTASAPWPLAENPRTVWRAFE